MIPHLFAGFDNTLYIKIYREREIFKNVMCIYFFHVYLDDKGGLTFIYQPFLNSTIIPPVQNQLCHVSTVQPYCTGRNLPRCSCGRPRGDVARFSNVFRRLWQQGTIVASRLGLESLLGSDGSVFSSPW